ncbi:MAG: M20/M25/M40 family metallo-hydrolase [Tissierellia bacterium]|nr:M20/M25/M40 family metallo-hydrolase [Tissierellia bacterium]
MKKIKKEEVTTLLENLVSIPSPYFEENEIMEYVNQWFEDRNIHSFIHTYHESKVTGFHGKNVIAQMKGKKPGPKILLNGHLDTVQPTHGWSKNPYGERVENLLYGIGALDMKSGCAAIMMAMEAFQKNVKEFKGEVLATFVSVEEGPYGMGTNALIEDGYMEDIDISIITEPSAGFTEKSYPNLCLGARGGYGLSVEFYGKSAHGANPHMGISALKDAAKFILECDHISYTNDEKLGTGDLCIIGMESNGGACSVPDFAKVNIFWHIVRGENEETIIHELEKAIKRANIKSNYKIIFRDAPSEESKGFQAYTVREDNSFVQSFMESVETICGEKPSISYFQSIGDFNYLGTRLETPALIFGANGKNYHSPDEFVDLETVYKTTKTLYQFLVDTLVEE